MGHLKKCLNFCVKCSLPFPFWHFVLPKVNHWLFSFNKTSIYAFQSFHKLPWFWKTMPQSRLCTVNLTGELVGHLCPLGTLPNILGSLGSLHPCHLTPTLWSHWGWSPVSWAHVCFPQAVIIMNRYIPLELPEQQHGGGPVSMATSAPKLYFLFHSTITGHHWLLSILGLLNLFLPTAHSLSLSLTLSCLSDDNCQPPGIVIYLAFAFQ